MVCQNPAPASRARCRVKNDNRREMEGIERTYDTSTLALRVLSLISVFTSDNHISMFVLAAFHFLSTARRHHDHFQSVGEKTENQTYTRQGLVACIRFFLLLL